MVYLSSSRALAALEILVHLNPPLHFGFTVIQVEFIETLVETVPTDSLPPDWRSQPSSPITRSTGDRWLREGRTAVLEVSSAIVPEESNYLINPLHPDFRSIKRAQPRAFAIDPRLLRGEMVRGAGFEPATSCV